MAQKDNESVVHTCAASIYVQERLAEIMWKLVNVNTDHQYLAADAVLEVYMKITQDGKWY